MTEPHFGWTRHGMPVHRHVHQYHPNGNAWNRFNGRVAARINSAVFTMNTFWLFNFLACASLPAVLAGVGLIHKGTLPGWLTGASFIALVAWVAQTYIQLVLLPAIGVNQNQQAAASDARAAKTFEDGEKNLECSLAISNSLNLETEGGLAVIEAHLKAQDAILAELRGNCIPVAAENTLPPGGAHDNHV